MHCTFLVHFCPVREKSVWVERNESDAYGAEEKNCKVKWLGSLDLARGTKNNFMWNH